MTRHEGRLVTVVPMEEALNVDPRLVGSDTRTLEAGEMVITRVLKLQHLDALSATNLLENMRLSMAVLPIEETRSLIITCYARRMTRIEQLLRMIDRPGRTRTFRSRRLKHTMAHMLISKLASLTEQLQTIPITIAPIQATSARTSQAGRTAQSPIVAQPSIQTVGISQARRSSTDADSRKAVYIDADERTNRILLLGYDEQILLVEELIDALDLPGHDLQTLRVYFLQHVDAEDARAKLEGLEIVGRSTATTRTAPVQLAQMTTVASNTTWVSGNKADLVEEPKIVVLDATNGLLINATEEQHNKIERIMSYIDLAAEDLRFLSVYDVNHLDAKDLKDKLTELGIVAPARGKSVVRRAYHTAKAPSQDNKPDRSPLALADETAAQPLFDQPQVIVRETTNSLVVYATQEQHAQIKETIPHLDAEALDQAIPYEIYFLENQDPEPLAGVLGKLIKETITDREGKVQQTVRKTEQEITIVPDKGTFSLIVYANRKNQDWISKLITALDKRRPQVLIDVTLVEITESDTFSYDLNMIRGWPDLESTSGISGTSPTSDMKGILLESASGNLTAFYGDGQIQALLTAVQTKNYGRVLAKPKILVNDNESGLIKTTDTTYVTVASAIPISSGGTNEATLVQTEQKYESYEAGITLDITPHISEGNLLRLAISLMRSDFLPTQDDEKPPNTTASEVSTAVTVPDGSTIILGGLLKLNQNKGDKKVPLLGDLPVLGGLFRSISNSDNQSKLYVFVKAEIIRPAGQGDQSMENLRTISERDRMAFEKHEAEVQDYESWPGIKSKPVAPAKVLDAR
jgi:type II secretory pathway component GspD/PulD (secretin)